MTEKSLPFTIEMLNQFVGLESLSIIVYLFILKNSLFLNENDYITTHKKLANNLGKNQAEIVDAVKQLEDRGVLMVRRHGAKPIKLTPIW